MSRQHTAEARARISHGLRRYHERRREAARVTPAALARLRSTGVASAALAPLVLISEAEHGELLAAIGGEDASPQRRVLLEDLVHVGLVLRSELARYVQAPDSEQASRIATLAGARRASLTALGLDRFERDALGVDDYTRALREAQAAQNHAEDANGVQSEQHHANGRDRDLQHESQPARGPARGPGGGVFSSPSPELPASEGEQ